MIIVLSKGKVDPAKLVAYREAVEHSGAIAATRQEAGNVYYDIAVSALKDGSVSIVEVWEGFPGLQGHTKGEALAKMTQINEKFGVTYETKLYKADPMG